MYHVHTWFPVDFCKIEYVQQTYSHVFTDSLNPEKKMIVHFLMASCARSEDVWRENVYLCPVIRSKSYRVHISIWNVFICVRALGLFSLFPVWRIFHTFCSWSLALLFFSPESSFVSFTWSFRMWGVRKDEHCIFEKNRKLFGVHFVLLWCMVPKLVLCAPNAPKGTVLCICVETGTSLCIIHQANCMCFSRSNMSRASLRHESWLCYCPSMFFSKTIEHHKLHFLDGLLWTSQSNLGMWLKQL